MQTATAQEFGHYLGKLTLQPLSDGRRMQLTESFGFVDADNKRWSVPIGAKIDGASIPSVLWSLIGGPFTGKYRDASVIHDYYCDVRTEPWHAVHRVFYAAMRASDVSERRAKIMYMAVYYAGPRWSDTTVDNANLLHPLGEPKTLFATRQSEFAQRFQEAAVVRGADDRQSQPPPILVPSHTLYRSSGAPSAKQQPSKGLSLDLERADSLVGTFSPTLDEIDRALDRAVETSAPLSDAPSRIRSLTLGALRPDD